MRSKLIDVIADLHIKGFPIFLADLSEDLNQCLLDLLIMIERYEPITHYRIDDDYAFTDIILCDRKYHHE